MGYMGLKHWVDSDMAADLAANAEKALVKVLRKGLKEKGNEFNTPGPVNVALFLEATIKDADYSDDLSKLILDTIGLLEKLIVEFKQEKWDDPSNKRMHMTALGRMVKNLKKIPLNEV
jgi:hypothetical protein